MKRFTEQWHGVKGDKVEKFVKSLMDYYHNSDIDIPPFLL